MGELNPFQSKSCGVGDGGGGGEASKYLPYEADAC